MGASNQLNNFTYLEVPNCLRETGTGGSNPLTPTIHSFKRSCRVVPAKSRQVLSDIRLLPIVAKPQVLEHDLGSAVPPTSENDHKADVRASTSSNQFFVDGLTFSFRRHSLYILQTI